MTWQDYTEHHPQHTVAGTLKQYTSLRSPQLNNQRDILVALPPSYEWSDRRYPVIYMHDGQNLFDQHTSFCGEWGVDETLQALGHEGTEAIVVGIPNMGADRIHEYSPFHDRRFGVGRADTYLSFIADTVKPLVDASFRTLPNREHTGILGSSMGGLVSLYGFFRYSKVFGFAGVMSPSLWFANGAILSYVAKAPYAPGKIYLDMGGREGITPSLHGGVSSGIRNARRMHKLLEHKGYRAGHDLLYVEDAEAEHTESAWAHRMPGALRFLLQPQPAPVTTTALQLSLA